MELGTADECKYIMKMYQFRSLWIQFIRRPQTPILSHWPAALRPWASGFCFLISKNRYNRLYSARFKSISWSSWGSEELNLCECEFLNARNCCDTKSNFQRKLQSLIESLTCKKKRNSNAERHVTCCNNDKSTHYQHSFSKKNLIIDILSWKQSWAPCSALEMLCHCMHVAWPLWAKDFSSVCAEVRLSSDSLRRFSIL